MKLAVAAVLAASLSVLAYGDVQEFDYKWEHPRLTIVRLQDATDAHDELLFTTEYVLSRCERTFDAQVRIEERSGSWRRHMGSMPDQRATGRVFEITVPHGVKPSAASCAWRVRPCALSVP